MGNLEFPFMYLDCGRKQELQDRTLYSAVRQQYPHHTTVLPQFNSAQFSSIYIESNHNICPLKVLYMLKTQQ